MGGIAKSSLSSDFMSAIVVTDSEDLVKSGTRSMQ